MAEVKYNLDLAVLRMLKHRANFERLANGVPAGTVNKETLSILRSFKAFFDATDVDVITHDEFWPFLRSRYPKWQEKDSDYWHALTKPIDKNNPDGYNDQVLRNLLLTKLANKAMEAVEAFNDDAEIDLDTELRASVDDFEASYERRVSTPTVELGWENMVEMEADESGIEWRMEAIRKAMRGGRPGDFGIIAMRPDRGKTSLVASEITYFAPQIAKFPDLFPGDFRPILWLNNEGPGGRILGRIRIAALGVNLEELVAMGAEAARAQYIENIGGREDMIQVKDIHGWKSSDVEELIRKINPSVVVFDMIDNIRFAGAMANNGERNDQVLETMYQWGRDMAVKHGFIGLATSQISADGDGMQYPTQPMLKDSKTGKQGACDWIITGGFDPNMPNTRFIGMTKNKLKRQGAPASPQAQVRFDADRCRFIAPKLED